MPVDDKPVHELTRRDSSRRYGCHNRPRRRDAYMAKDGFYQIYSSVSAIQMKIIDDFGSLECRYDKSLTDPACNDCQHRGSGEEYSAGMIERAK